VTPTSNTLGANHGKSGVGASVDLDDKGK